MKTSSSLMKLSLKYLHCYFQQTNKPPRDNYVLGYNFSVFYVFFFGRLKPPVLALTQKQRMIKSNMVARTI